MPVTISRRGKRSPPSPIRKLSPLADAAQAKGISIYHLNIGQPDIQSPKEFFDGVNKFSRSVIEYEPSRGRRDLCEAWCSFFNRSLNTYLDADNFLITMGGSEALVYAFCTVCDPGESILVFDPSYANYLGFASLCGIELNPVPTTIEDGFHLPEIATISKYITSKTKAILVSNPNNPTGTAYSKKELQLLLDVANERGLFLIVDEAYREFVYDESVPYTIYNLDGPKDNVIMIDSLSKRFSLCGARIGALVTTNTEVFTVAWKMAQARLAAPSIEQVAAVHLLQNVQEGFVKDAVSEYALRRNALFESLNGIRGVHAHKPEGAFYTVVRLPVENAEDFCCFLLRDFSYQKSTTFLAPASGFYLEEGRGKDEVRIAYVLKCEDIVKAVHIIEKGLEAYKGAS